MPEVPISIPSVVLTGRYIRPDGTPLTGTLTFEPPAHLTIPDADIITAGAATVELDSTGAFSVSLIATDNAATQPSDWAYTVVERLQHADGRTFHIKLPASTPVVDLADIAPTNPDGGDYVVVAGPPGAPGSKIYAGAGAPSNTLGIDGDYYVDTTVGAVQFFGPKASGAWPTTGVALGGGAGGVTSVNTKTGAVTLSAADVGALPADGTVATGNLFLVGAAGTYRGFNFQSGANKRWVFQVDNAAESGADAGSNFDLSAWTDAGAWKSTVLAGKRNTGDLAVGANQFTAGAKLTVNGPTALRNASATPVAPDAGVTLFAQGDVLKQRKPNGSTSVIGGEPGIYVPSNWGSFWRAKRDTAGTGRATIAVVGGSASQGFYASNPITKSWPGVIRTALQAQYGDGGSGFMTSSLSSTILSSGDAAALAAWQSAGAIIGQTGTWLQGGSKFGPGINYLYTDTTGGTLTFKARGTTVKLYTVVGSGTRPNMKYSIDGAATQTVAQPSGTAAIQVTTVTGLSAAEHTIVITCDTTSTGNYLSVVGVEGLNATGVVVNNLALAGASSASYANNLQSALNSTWNGGVDYPADLVIFTAGPNDATANTTGDAWAANVAKFLKAVRDTSTATGTTDVMIMLPHLGVHDVTNFKYQDYALRGRALAEVYGAAFVNMWALGRNSWEYWRTLGYWGTSAGTGAAGTDAVHMSDAGFQFMANQILPLLTS
ncbi:GDSL-type esterase/lipase family protein [Streptomyces sp. NPDC005813]|uniref:GDSL-type esterase/lipase family protein n=1 Tax=Streptomyces sp. NPDC005813 TaxID=3155592 RepID=UPI0033CA0D59